MPWAHRHRLILCPRHLDCDSPNRLCCWHTHNLCQLIHSGPTAFWCLHKHFGSSPMQKVQQSSVGIILACHASSPILLRLATRRSGFSLWHCPPSMQLTHTQCGHFFALSNKIWYENCQTHWETGFVDCLRGFDARIASSMWCIELVNQTGGNALCLIF